MIDNIYSYIASFKVFFSEYKNRDCIHLYTLNIFRTSCLLFLCFSLSNCKKLVQVGEPVDTITSSETFKTEANATAALIQIYSSMSNDQGNFSIGNGLITICAGLSADELNYFGTDPQMLQFQSNSLQSKNSVLNGQLWSPAYKNIYYANAVIEGVQISNNISQNMKDELIGEAKFLRAFTNFYLVNIFGDVPLISTTDWTKIVQLPRTSKEDVYKNIVSDLKESQNLLPDDYSVSGGERTRANKSAATALLARVYLYMGNWADAVTQATSILDNLNNYSLTKNLADVFLKDNVETILELEVNSDLFPYTVREANQIIPEISAPPNYYITSQLLSAFEVNDQRKKIWIDSIDFLGKKYYYPFKYTVRQGEGGADVPQYYILLRIAEQYLIRAEANAHLNNLNKAIDDVNVIRSRAELSKLFYTSNQTEVFAAIVQERRIEFFAEWGHRWLDLKRTGVASSTLSIVKSGWKTGAELYPIPWSEIQTDPNLSQNSGYDQ
ncbi:SusD family protein [Chitinophaga sp. YR573]|uniref:RagB/SusD family nutrient uptake outer membrane protein n=1 Tax=Chitinophaga sp. YR573 TaxID=1881040 RepID=UPI0008BA226F|nr:RagB/SusD family nutrient uptake outer membrane protein [Chitinophaga sp. YR573]SEW04717.1 SusD family protein [Chitinophaga sp. YR573]